MLIIPAIDIRDGKCVRLVKGKLEQETVYSDRPEEIAKVWEAKGAPMLHLVDLDGAFGGEPKNLQVIARIREAVSVPLQLGGGIRNLEAMETILAMGVDRLILGTAAAEDAKLLQQAVDMFGDKVAVGVDNKEGKVAVEGWKSHSTKGVLDFALTLQHAGVSTVIYTDTSRDGTLIGPNIEGISKFLERVPDIQVIISGGIASLDDLKELKEMSLYYPNIEGVILGKSLYGKTIVLEDALEIGRC
jgi:phosphoribosylformimino-5-aminoimidazole carboxamide ribotide isomerase